MKRRRFLTITALTTILPNSSQASPVRVSLPGRTWLVLPEGAAHRFEERLKTTIVAVAPGRAVSFNALPGTEQTSTGSGHQFIEYLAANNPGELFELKQNGSKIFIMSRTKRRREKYVVHEINGAIGFSHTHYAFSATASEEFLSTTQAEAYVRREFLDLLGQIRSVA